MNSGEKLAGILLRIVLLVKIDIVVGKRLHRDWYRHAGDFIICSHDFYMEHIWTKESRKREGQLPLLPEHSCVVFDEGHLLEYASQKALTYRFSEQILRKPINQVTGK